MWLMRINIDPHNLAVVGAGEGDETFNSIEKVWLQLVAITAFSKVKDFMRELKSHTRSPVDCDFDHIVPVCICKPTITILSSTLPSRHSSPPSHTYAPLPCFAHTYQKEFTNPDPPQAITHPASICRLRICLAKRSVLRVELGRFSRILAPPNTLWPSLMSGCAA